MTINHSKLNHHRLKKALTHRGYAHIDVFQPCVTFNRVNTYQWFQENTYYLDDSHDPYDRVETFRRIKKIRPEAKVMMMTAYAVENLVQDALREGVYGVIHKPLAIEKLVDLIGNKNKDCRKSHHGIRKRT